MTEIFCTIAPCIPFSERDLLTDLISSNLCRAACICSWSFALTKNSTSARSVSTRRAAAGGLVARTLVMITLDTGTAAARATPSLNALCGRKVCQPAHQARHFEAQQHLANQFRYSLRSPAWLCRTFRLESAKESTSQFCSYSIPAAEERRFHPASLRQEAYL